MFKNLIIIAFLFTTSAPLLSYGGDLEETFFALKDQAVDYESTGTICEQVARLELAERFPAPAYESVTGIVYGSLSNNLGELDVVVFNGRTGKAVLIAEVKCWRNLNSARIKAREQRERFIRAMETPDGIGFHLAKKPETEYRPEQFAGQPEFIAIAQQGGAQAGFEKELGFTLDELMQLRKKLMDCQKAGACPRPYQE